MRASSKDSVTYELPNNTDLNLWASPGRPGRWSFFWAEFLAPRVPKAWFRVFPKGTKPGDWQPFKRGSAVLKQTDYANDPAILADTDEDGGEPELQVHVVDVVGSAVIIKYGTAEIIMDGGVDRDALYRVFNGDEDCGGAD